MVQKVTKSKVMKEHGTHAKDTGSAEVQIALFTEKIKQLTEHLKTHKKDHKSYEALVKKLQLRR
jgi:small subunit ribosomal protein S15